MQDWLLGQDNLDAEHGVMYACLACFIHKERNMLTVREWQLQSGVSM